MIRIALFALALSLVTASVGCVDQEDEQQTRKSSTSDDPDQEDQNQDEQEQPPAGCRASLRQDDNCRPAP